MPRGSNRIDILAILLIDLLFVLLPFIVYAGIFAVKNTLTQVFQLPGWSFAASIFYGRTIVKFVSVVINKKISTGSERVALIITILLILGVVPSLLAVFFIVNANPPSTMLVIAQLAIFVFAVIVYFFFGLDLSAEENR